MNFTENCVQNKKNFLLPLYTSVLNEFLKFENERRGNNKDTYAFQIDTKFKHHTIGGRLSFFINFASLNFYLF